MKEFNLKEALDGAKLVYRDGSEVTSVFTTRKDGSNTFTHKCGTETYTDEGTVFVFTANDKDLFMAETKVESMSEMELFEKLPKDYMIGTTYFKKSSKKWVICSYYESAANNEIDVIPSGYSYSDAVFYGETAMEAILNAIDFYYSPEKETLKEGDCVVVTNNYNAHEFNIGQYVIITDIDWNDYRCSDGINFWHLGRNEIKLK